MIGLQKAEKPILAIIDTMLVNFSSAPILPRKTCVETGKG